MEKTDILSLSKEELEEKILAMGEKKFRAGQIYDWLHINKVEEFSKMTNLSAQLREKLDDIFWINSLKIQKRLVSDIDNTVKYLTEKKSKPYLWNTSTATASVYQLRSAAKWDVNSAHRPKRDS